MSSGHEAWCKRETRRKRVGSIYDFKASWCVCGEPDPRQGERRKVLDLMQVLKQSIMRGPDDDGGDRRQSDRRHNGGGDDENHQDV